MIVSNFELEMKKGKISKEEIEQLEALIRKNK